jgi:DNA-binding NarL/FixJ family response regulator
MKVLLVDDHALFLEGLKNLLSARGIQVVGTACDGLDALEKVRALQPDVVLMDIQMPRCNGLQATRLIKAERPEIKIVMLTVSGEDEDLFEAIKSGASGYVLKNLDAAKFFDLLSGLEQGRAALSPGLAAKIMQEFARQSGGSAATSPLPLSEQLTPKQIELLTLVAQGSTYKEVAAALNLSEPTIKYHMGEIIKRLHLKNRAQAIAYAERMGLLKPSSG